MGCRNAISMIALLASMALAAASGGIGDGPSAEAVEPPAGFTALFNGEDLTGWREESLESGASGGSGGWRIEHGAIVSDDPRSALISDRSFGDLELRLECRAAPEAKVGLILRGAAPLELAIGPVAWTAVRVVLIGERLSVVRNQSLVIDRERLESPDEDRRPLPPRGPLALAARGGASAWRNLFVRSIPPDEANELLERGGLAPRVDEPPFTPIFNGRDFTGWSGPIDSYEIVDGTIRCRPGQGGTIYTNQEYGDFIVRLQFLLPPGGNNGLAIRYPGEGDTAYVGLCELQVLDDDHPRFANLDPRQYHGSVYGQVAAHRGYLRPAGTWNYQEVTVKGSTITVELNGTRIVDADLEQVTELMYDRERFSGRNRTRGHFGFAGHNDPVQFRNLRIMALESPSQASDCDTKPATSQPR